LFFNIIATVGTVEVELAPYPGGAGAVPAGRARKIFTLIATNKAATNNALTLRIYRGDVVEKSLDIIVPASSTLVITNTSPILIVPSNRTLKAIAATENIDLLLTCLDE